MLAEVLLGLIHIGLNGGWVCLWVPVGGAHLAVLLDELEGLDQTQHFVHRTSNGQIIDRVLTQYALGINDECAAQRDSFLVQQHIVVGRYLLGQIGEQGIFQFANAAALAVNIAPGQVTEMRIHRDTDDLSVDVVELLNAFAKCNNFRGTYKGAGEERGERELQLVGASK